MSLMQRVCAAGNSEQRSCVLDKEQLFSRLKSDLTARMSTNTIAELAVENPAQARNEIRSACKSIFEGDFWVTRDEQQKEALISDLLDDVFGLGPLESMLEDEDITEIMVNGTQSVYYEKQGRLCRSEFSFTDDGQVRALIDRVLGPVGRRIDESSPMVSARLPQGYRVNAIIPPLAIDGPTMTIRKFAARVMRLDEMVALGSMDTLMVQLLKWAVYAKRSIAVSGGTGSGKTTLLNALSCEISADERVVTIEDSAELRFFEHPHVVRLEARPRNAEGVGEVSIRDLVINALRMRPDRIVVGECRAGEALDMLQAMNTGHDGSLTTLHANAPDEAVMRLATMVRYVADLPVDVIEAHIASAIDLVVQIARDHDGNRFITQVAELHFSRENRRCGVVNLFDRQHLADTGRWLSLPRWIDDLVTDGRATFEEVAQWKQAALSLA